MEPPVALDYASQQARKPVIDTVVIRRLGGWSILLCAVQLPWTAVAAWAYWGILWGDVQPPMAGFVMWYIVAALPCMLAITLGLIAIFRRDTVRFDGVAGVVGCLGGIAWACFFVRAFLGELASRW